MRTRRSTSWTSSIYRREVWEAQGREGGVPELLKVLDLTVVHPAREHQEQELERCDRHLGRSYRAEALVRPALCVALGLAPAATAGTLF